MNEFTKKYQVWELSEGTQYVFTEYDTLAECVSAQKHGAWYITKRVSIRVADADEPIIVPASVSTTFASMKSPTGTEVVEGLSPEELEAKTALELYEKGNLGKIAT